MDVKKDQVSQCYDFTVDCSGECSHCGECCSTYLPMSVKEFKALKRWARRHHYKPASSTLLNDVEIAFDANCPFLDPNTRECVCYDIRPEVCRTFNCHDAVVKGKEYKQKSGNRTVHNLRAEIFNEEVPSFLEFQALKEYIEGRKHAKSKD